MNTMEAARNNTDVTITPPNHHAEMDSTDGCGDEVAAAISQYTPRHFALNEAVLSEARKLVRAAQPRSVRETNWAMSYTYRFVLWADAAGFSLDAELLADNEAIERFLDDSDVTVSSSRRRMRSFLTRIGADGALTPVERSGTDRKPSATELEHQHLDEVAAAEVAAALTAYTPARVSADRWARVADVVRDAVAATKPARAQRAVSLCRSAAYLATWVDSQHLPIDREVVFDGTMIERFLAAVAAGGMHPRTIATHAADLHHLRSALGYPEPSARRTWPAPTSSDPYSSADIDRLFVQADHLATPNRRRYANNALLLMFGAGATPGDIAAVRAEDIHIDGSTVTVTFTSPVRTVRVLDTYREALAAVAKTIRAHGGVYLIGGDSNQRRKNRLSQLMNAGWERKTRVDVEPGRARATWLVEAASEPGRYPTVIDLLDEAGYATFDRFSNLTDAIRARTEELAR